RAWREAAARPRARHAAPRGAASHAPPATARAGFAWWRLRRASFLRHQLPQRRPLAPAHRQLFLEAVEHHDPVRLVVAVGAALEAADRGARHQAVAMDANEARSELALERDQRLLDQVLAVARA